MTEIGSVTAILFVAFIGGLIGKRLGYTRIMGQLVASLLFGVPFIQHALLSSSTGTIVETMAELGVILLLLLTGFEMDIEDMKKASRDSILIAIGSAIAPFTLGTILGFILHFDWKTACVLGMCLSVTAEGTTTALLLEINQLKTKIGSILLSAGILDDVFEVIFLAAVLILSHNGDSSSLAAFPIHFGIFLLVTVLAFRYIPKYMRYFETNGDGVGMFSGTLAIGLILAFASELAGLGSILGAFMAGMIMQKSYLRDSDKIEEEHLLSMISFSLIVPFFFVNIGMHMDFNGLLQAPVLSISVFGVALCSKILGSFLVHPWTTLSFKQTLLVGWGMNSRGVMEIVIAQLALANGLIDSTLYSAIVFTAITTTMLYPFVIRHMIKMNPKIMIR